MLHAEAVSSTSRPAKPTGRGRKRKSASPPCREEGVPVHDYGTCLRCRSAHVRCDRQWPCGRCLRIDEVCGPWPPQRDDNNADGTAVSTKGADSDVSDSAGSCSSARPASPQGGRGQLLSWVQEEAYRAMEVFLRAMYHLKTDNLLCQRKVNRFIDALERLTSPTHQDLCMHLLENVKRLSGFDSDAASDKSSRVKPDPDSASDQEGRCRDGGVGAVVLDEMSQRSRLLESSVFYMSDDDESAAAMWYLSGHPCVVNSMVEETFVDKTEVESSLQKDGVLPFYVFARFIPDSDDHEEFINASAIALLSRVKNASTCIVKMHDRHGHEFGCLARVRLIPSFTDNNSAVLLTLERVPSSRYIRPTLPSTPQSSVSTSPCSSPRSGSGQKDGGQRDVSTGWVRGGLAGLHAVTRVLRQEDRPPFNPMCQAGRSLWYDKACRMFHEYILHLDDSDDDESSSARSDSSYTDDNNDDMQEVVLEPGPAPQGLTAASSASSTLTTTSASESMSITAGASTSSDFAIGDHTTTTITTTSTTPTACWFSNSSTASITTSDSSLSSCLPPLIITPVHSIIIGTDDKEPMPPIRSPLSLLSSLFLFPEADGQECLSVGEGRREGQGCCDGSEGDEGSSCTSEAGVVVGKGVDVNAGGDGVHGMRRRPSAEELLQMFDWQGHEVEDAGDEGWDAIVNIEF